MSHDLVTAVAGQPQEGVVGEDDRIVGQTGVGEDRRRMRCLDDRDERPEFQVRLRLDHAAVLWDVLVRGHVDVTRMIADADDCNRRGAAVVSRNRKVPGHSAVPAVGGPAASPKDIAP